MQYILKKIAEEKKGESLIAITFARINDIIGQELGKQKEEATAWIS